MFPKEGYAFFLTKRIIALESQIVTVKGSETFINGEKIEESYAYFSGEKPSGINVPHANSEVTPIRVPEGKLFVMGDNRDNSFDSRDPKFGFVDVEGIDANIHMGRILKELDKLSQTLLKSPAHPLLGPPSLHVPVIRGGSELFVYSDRCKISVERRTLPGEVREDIMKEMDSMLSRLSANDRKFQASVKPILYRNPYEIPPDSEIVKLISKTTEQVLGRPPGYIGHYWWEDSALIAETGIETAIFGPKGDGIHSPEEWVDIQSVVDFAHILTQIAIQYCG